MLQTSYALLNWRWKYFQKIDVYFRKEWEINLTIWHTFPVGTRKIAHWEIAPRKIIPYPNPNPKGGGGVWGIILGEAIFWSLFSSL